MTRVPADLARRLLAAFGGLALGSGAAPGGEGGNALEARNLTLGTQADGALLLRADALAARGLALRSPEAELSLGELRLERVQATFGAAGASPAVSLQAGRVVLQGLALQAAWPAARPQGLALPPCGAPRLQALGGLDGVVNAHIADAAWIIDADVRLPVARGRIDMAAVEVAHVGPNSVMGLDEHGLYVESLGIGRRPLLLLQPGLAGVTPGSRAWLPFIGNPLGHDRGTLDLALLLPALLAAAGLPARPADAQSARSLARMSLGTELLLGDGALGCEALQLRLDGRLQGSNRLLLQAQHLGERLQWQWPRLSAAEATLSLPGLGAASGAIEGELGGELQGLQTLFEGEVPTPALRVALRVQRLQAEGLRISSA